MFSSRYFRLLLLGLALSLGGLGCEVDSSLIPLYQTLTPQAQTFAPATPTPFPTPTTLPGFNLLQSAPGVQLYRKDYTRGNPDFVQVINLSQGAQLRLLHGPLQNPGSGQGVYGGDNPIIIRQHLEQFWQETHSAHPNIFCVTNGQFFRLLEETTTQLPFPLKVDGVVLSDGYGINDFPDQKLMLEIWQDHLSITPLSREALYGSSAPNIVAGLAEDAPKNIKKAVGRTFTGIDDRDGDGVYETLLIFNTLTSTQADAAAVLRSFGAEAVMMLDGGGSAQLICGGQPLVASDRPVPQALAVLAGGSLLPPAPAETTPAQPPPTLPAAGTPLPGASPSPTSPAQSAAPVQSAVPAQSAAPSNQGSLYLAQGGGPQASDLLWVLAVILPVTLVVAVIVARINR